MKTCKVCGKEFHHKVKQTRSCSDQCKKEIKKAREKVWAQIEVTKTCLNCGAKFPSTNGRRGRHCNPDCRDQYRVRKQRQWINEKYG